MSRKIKNILISIFLVFMALGFYLNKNQIQPELKPNGYSYYQKGDYKEAFNYFSQHAESDPQAAFSLAMMYWDGIGVDKNALASQKWLIKSANLQNKNALYNLGYLRNKGLIQSPTDDAQGLTSLTKAADLGSSIAKDFLHDLNFPVIYYDQKEYTLLPIYGEQSWSEKKRTLEELEKLAEEGNKEAVYQYLENKDSVKQSRKTKNMIRPFIEEKDPKMMYLKYKLISQDINLLFDSAYLNYPEATYLLYQIYKGDKKNYPLQENSFLANIYLKKSADLAHHDGLIKIIEKLNNSDTLSSNYFRNLLEKYINTLLLKYPNSPQAMLALANVYLKPNSSFYNFEKALKLVERAYNIQPSPESKLLLAKLYSNSERVHQNIRKAVSFLQENITNDKLTGKSQRELVKIYFDFGASDYLKKEEIVNILRESVIKNKSAGTFNQNYSLAHFYADLLLEENVANNEEYAFSLYQKARGYAYEATFHQAIATIKYKNIIDDQALINIVSELKDDLESRRLTEKKRQEGYSILFRYGMDLQYVIDFIVERSLYDDKIRKAIQPLLSQNKNLAFQYTIKNIIHENSANNINEDNLKKYYKDIFKLAEIGSIDAIKFIITKEYKDKNARDEIYQDYSFDKLTNITIKERLAWRRKCADLGDFICLKELAIIYRDGKEGVRKNIAKASEYERRISINSSHFELESEKYEIDRRWKEKRDNTLDYLLNQKESSKQQLELARFYSIEDSGRSLIYAKKAYDLGNKEAAELIYWYYMQNICEDKDNINKADYYLKEWLTTGEEPSKYSSSNEYKYSSISIISDYYLESPCLVERNLDKAIEWYQLSLDYPYEINDFLYSELNNMYTNAPKYISKDPFVNVYLSTLKNHNDYILDMNIRLGKMNFAISSFDKLYEALLLKGDVKEAYYYGLLLNYDVNNVAMFYSLSDIERKNIEYRVADYLKEIQK